MCAFTNVAIGSDIRSNDQSCYRAHSLVFCSGACQGFMESRVDRAPIRFGYNIAIITSSSTFFFFIYHYGLNVVLHRYLDLPKWTNQQITDNYI